MSIRVRARNHENAGPVFDAPSIVSCRYTNGKFLYNEYGGKLTMDGHAVYDFAVGIMTKIIKDLMEKENLTEHDVDFFVCHQANERILKASARRLGFRKQIRLLPAISTVRLA